MHDAYDSYWSVVASAAALALGWALLWSVPALWARRNDLADVAWGLTFPMLALLTGGVVVAPDPAAEPRAACVVVLLLAWGMRLATHIARRMVGHDEDKRYAAQRSRWGGAWRLRSVIQVFLLQAVVALVVAQPVLIAASVHPRRTDLNVLDALALLLVVAGVLLETIADRQLARFVARKRAGEVDGYLTSGVWSWSRHPNYAGDALTWWGFGLFGVAAALDLDAGWLVLPALLGPAVMTAFLRWGSGVPMTERGRAGQPQWDAYVARTSAFLPRPPRR